MSEEEKSDRYALVITTGGACYMLHCDAGDGFELKTLQDIVEGYIETTRTVFKPLEHGTVRPVLVVNEEGKLQGLRRNMAATRCCLGDVIAGNAILMGVRGAFFVGFLREDAEKIKEYFEF